MKRLHEGGAKAVYPKVLKCSNCGNEVSVDSFGDLAQNMPHFVLVRTPPGAFQFGCPNNCGGGYVATDVEIRREFHYAKHVSYGFPNVKLAAFGTRALDPKKNQFTYEASKRRQPRRRKGGNDGPVFTPR